MMMIRQIPMRSHLPKPRWFSQLSENKFLKSFLKIHPEVQQALHERRAVVALESTIISHGMPFPQNVQTARAVENIIRQEGAVPATIAIANGQILVGLDDEWMERLASIGKDKVLKTSRRDLVPLLSRGRFASETSQGPVLGATTVSGTMLLAHLAGIKIFVTGGIGGVHRGAESTFDISADLTELGKTPVAVVCAGAKSILDIPKTLEYLETQGVSVVSVGSRNFPAFYAPDSGLKSPTSVQSHIEAAQMVLTHEQLRLDSGMVFAVPIPENDEKKSSRVQLIVEEALEECKTLQISGKETTPFLLKRIGELSAGDSLALNIALIKNNARFGAKMAVEYAALQNTTAAQPSLSMNVPRTSSPMKSVPIFIGGSAMDVICKLKSTDGIVSAQETWGMFLRTSSPAVISETPGGVVRNAAEACHRVMNNAKEITSRHPVLVSSVGNDTFGNSLVQSLQSMGMATDEIKIFNEETNRTPVYNAILDPAGKLIVAGADMELLTNSKFLEHEEQQVLFEKYNPSLVCIDVNMSENTVLGITKHCEQHSVPLFFEPTSVPKAHRLFRHTLGRPIHESGPGSLLFISPNEEELVTMSALVQSDPSIVEQQLAKCRTDLHIRCMESNGHLQLLNPSQVPLPQLNNLIPHILNLLNWVPNIVLKMGAEGVVLCQRVNTSNLHDELSDMIGHSHPSANDDLKETSYSILNNASVWEWYGTDYPVRNLRITHYLSDKTVSDRIINVTGAGDTLVGTMIAGLDEVLTMHSLAAGGADTNLTDGLQNSPLWNYAKLVWPQLSSINRHLLLFNDECSFMDPSRPQILDRIMMRARTAAELTCQHEHAVHPQISSLDL